MKAFIPIRVDHRLSWLLVALLLVALPSCATTSIRLPALESPPLTPDALVAVLAERESRLKDLQARFRIDLRIDGIRQKGSGALFYRRGEALKLDIGDRVLGIGIMSALAHGDSLDVYLHRENRFLRGDAADVLYAVTGVNVAYYSLERALLGLPGFAAADTQRVTRFQHSADSLLVEVLDPLWTRQLCFHAPTGLLLTERVLTPGGSPLSERHLTDYRMEAGVALAGTVLIRQGRDRITVRYGRREANTGLPDARFKFSVPSDAVEIVPGS